MEDKWLNEWQKKLDGYAHFVNCIVNSIKT